MIAGAVSQDTFYTNDESGRRFENVKVLLVGTEQGQANMDKVLDSMYTNENGEFEFNQLIEGKSYYIYFDSLPDGYSITYNPDAAAGKTRWRRVEVPVCDLHLGLGTPKENINANARVALGVYQDGAALGHNKIATSPGFLSIPFNPFNRGIRSNNTYQASYQETGSLWGTDYQCSTGKVFASAVLKRHSGLGPYVAPALDGGVQDVPVDGIYMIEYKPQEQLIGAFTLQGVNGIDLGTVKREVISREIILTDDQMESSDPYALVMQHDTIELTESYDIDAFDKVGKTGFGSLSMGPSDRYAWVINLHQKNIIRIEVGSGRDLPTDGSAIDPSLVDVYPIDYSELPSCNGELRPWAIEFHNGTGYVGLVCDASISQSSEDLVGYVLSFDPDQLNVLENDFDLVMDFPLNYRRENIFDVDQQWQAWVSEWPHPISDDDLEEYYAQPILTDLEFDSKNRMIISLIDRFGFQASRENVAADLSDQTPTFTANAAGDILLACPTENGLYEIEGAGGCTHNNDSGTSEHGSLALDNDGPAGAGEYFPYDHLTDYSGNSPAHYEIAVGASAIHPHHENVLHNVYDPMTANYSLGVHQYDLNDGTLGIAYQITPGNVSKANGLGDFSLISELVSLEIGNYVWIDENENGIQESWEQPVSGVNVSLLDMSGEVLATVQTDENGAYYFKDSTPGFDGLQPFTMYHLVLGDNQYDEEESLILGRYKLTQANANAGFLQDERDSDFKEIPGQPTNYEGFPSLKITTGARGQVDHSFDAGLVEVEDPCPELISLNVITPDPDYCLEELIRFELNHTEDTFTLDIVYSAQSGLSAQEVYYGDWNDLGLNVLIEDLRVLQSPTNFGIDDLPAGNWTIYVKLDENSPFIDNPDCLPLVSSQVTVGENPEVVLQDLSVCEGSDITITAQSSGGTPPYSYEWQDGSRGDRLELTNVQNSSNVAVTITDLNGCTDQATSTITVNENLDVNLNQPVICEGSTVELIPEINGGQPPFSYNWSTGESTRTIQLIVFANVIHSVTVTDANGCTGQATSIIQVNDNLEVVATGGEYCEGTNGKIDLQVSGSAGPYDYVWTPDWIADDGSFTSDTSFNFSVLVTDNITGCEGSASGRVIVHPVVEIDPPSNVQECAFYVLPEITGRNLTNEVAYYSQMNGGGLRFEEGDTIYQDIRLYIYDRNATIDDCNDEVSFLIEIIDETPDANLIPGDICLEDSPYTPEVENELDLNELIVSGPTDGTWTSEPDGLIFNGRILRIPEGFEHDSVLLSYFVEGNVSSSASCGDKEFTTLVEVNICTAKLGDLVWEDKNANGLQDAGEPGIPNQKLILTGVTSAGQSIMLMDTTDQDGLYMFCLLPPGEYKVTFPQIDGYTETIHDVNGDDAIDSDANPENGNMTDLYALEEGDTTLTVDAGYFRLSKLGDFVWEDLNANGIQDPGEPGIEDVRVVLTGTDVLGNEIELETTTDATGMYMFGDLVTGDYKVTFEQPQNYLTTELNVTVGNGNEANDSDADPENGHMTDTYTLPPGDTVLVIDAGFFRLAALGDYVWIDEDKDGVQDSTEACVDSAQVFLYTCENPDSPIDSMWTENCRYLFDSLIPDRYFVEFVNPDNKGYSITVPNIGSDDGRDSDADPESLRTHCTNLTSGETDLTLDMGLVACPTLDSVACIKEVQVSIGTDGNIEITPAMILTISQDCDGLEVMIIDTLGNEYGTTVTCDMIGKDFRVMVTDANGNACWAQLTIEDKIPPRLICPPPLDLNCDEDPTPGQPQVRRFEVEPAAILGPDAGQVTSIPVAVPNLGNLSVSGVNIYMDIDMENTLDFIAPGAITLTSPEGTVYDVYPLNVNPNCQLLFGVTGVDHGYDDSSARNFAVCQDFQSQNDFIPFGGNLDRTFAGESAEGTWTWNITDQFDSQSGLVNRLVIELELVNTIELPQVIENCNYELDFEDIVDNRNACGIGSVIREWTATDQSGNTGSCTQTITFQSIDRPDIIYPGDYEADCLVDPNSLTPDVTGEVRILGDQTCVQYAIGSEDLFLDDCAPYGFKIRRTWTVLDWCDPDFEDSFDQIIKVVDDEAPVIDCPADFTVSLRHNDCETNISLPQATATDNCDFNVMVTRELLDPNGVVVPTAGVPVGTYKARYIAEDACENTDTCFVWIRVIDPVAPVAVCFRDLVVSLTSDGWAYLCAEQINDGSYDNCTDVGLQIKRESDPNWAFYDNEIRQNNCVRFQCRDLGTDRVNLRVWDDADGDGFYGPQSDTNGDGRIDETDDTGDNYSECWTNVRIEDKLPPVLICPPDVSINCLDDYRDLELTGEADADGNCANINATYTDQLPNQICPGSVIERTWTVEKRLAGSDGILNTPDDVVTSRSCLQRITLEDDTPLAILKLPGDVTVNCQDADGLDPQDLEKFNFFDDYLDTPQNPGDDSLVVFDEPRIDYDCEQLAINFSDRQFDLCENAYKIKRTWTIIDWCNPDFELIHVQTLLREDTEAPQINVTVNNPGANENGNCQGLVDFDITGFDNCGTATITHNSPYSNDLSDPSGYYPVGSYELTITAVDQCGNVNTELVNFTVSDVRLPVAICKYGLGINMKPDGMVTLDANLLDVGSMDNCTSADNLIFEIQRLDSNGDLVGPRAGELVFDCSHIGEQRIRMYVIDEAGNEAYCETRVIVEDNADVCSQTGTISGIVETASGLPIPDVEIRLNGRSQGVFDGNYLLDSVSAYGNINLSAHRDLDHREGVTTLDLVEIRKHILQVDQLDNPYKILAADVDMSKSISVLDILALRQLILRKTNRLTNAESWHFVPQNHVFALPENPWKNPVPYYAEFSASPDPLNVAFTGFKMGDVNESAFLAGGISRRIEKWEMNYHWSQEGSEKYLTVETGSDQLQGYQMALKLPGSYFELLGVDGELSNQHISQWKVDPSVLFISWTAPQDEQDAIGSFTLRFGQDSERKMTGIELAEEMMAEVYTQSDIRRKIELRAQAENTENYALHSNYPDPFNDKTLVPFDVPRPEMATLRIYSAQGLLIYENEQWADRGRNEWSIDHTDLQGPGFYYYQVELKDFVAIRKMLFVK